MHEVGASGDGMTPARATVDVAAGELRRVELEAGERIENAGDSLSTGGVLNVPYEDPYEPWFWTSFGIAAAAAAGAAATGGLALWYWDEWKADGGLDGNDKGQTGQLLANVGDALIGVAAAAGIAATVLYFFLSDVEEIPYAEPVEIGLLPTGLVLRW